MDLTYAKNKAAAKKCQIKLIFEITPNATLRRQRKQAPSTQKSAYPQALQISFGAET